jgi:hypothetical protein
MADQDGSAERVQTADQDSQDGRPRLKWRERRPKADIGK